MFSVRFTKMGFAGNSDPSYIQPTVIATRETPNASGGTIKSVSSVTKRGIEDLDFFIGDEAIANGKTYALNYPIRHGQIENWDYMERYWEKSIFKYLRCEPEDHYFLLVCVIIWLMTLYSSIE
jgi:actin-related protein 3